jgi:hypothetical protein
VHEKDKYIENFRWKNLKKKKCYIYCRRDASYKDGMGKNGLKE